MALTQAEIVTSVKRQFKRTDKDDDIKEAIQFIVDDIVNEFKDFRGLHDVSASLSLTTDISSVSISTLTALYGSRIRTIALSNSSNATDNKDLDEISFTDYLRWLPNPAVVSNVEKGYPEEYTLDGETLYLKPVPDASTYSIKVHYGKIHPTVSASQNILFPAHFKMCIVNGVLWQIYQMVEDSKGKDTKHAQIYIQLRDSLILAYSNKPDMHDEIKANVL